MKTKLKIIIPVMIAVIAVVIAVFTIQFTPASTNEMPDIAQMLSTAQKYLSEQNFEQAIAEFEKVISLEPKNVEAYKGIADAYIGLGNPDMAIEWMEKGIAETDSDDLANRLTDLLDGLKKIVPEIENLDRDDIEKVLTDAGINYNISEEYSDSIPAGKIISDNIPDDKKISDMDKIIIVISRGSEKVIVPDFSNLSYTEAELLAKNSKLTVSRNDIYSKEIEAECIITQAIPVDAEVPVNTNILLTVSLGVEMVVVPDLTNLSRSDAEKILSDNKLVARISEEYSDTVEKSIVVGQSVIAGENVESGTAIDVVISLGSNSVVETKEEFITIKGEQYSTLLTELILTGKGITDEDIKQISKMTNLTYLNLSDNQIKDISPLKKLVGLEKLGIADNQISDVSHLAMLTNLKTLSIGGNSISDISPLKNLSNLEMLGIGRNEIKNVAALSNFTNLTWLDISHNQISDIDSLKHLTKLKTLYVEANIINDISPLSNLVNLNELWLGQNEISDISPLRNLNNLTNVSIKYTYVSFSDIDELRNRLPNCEVEY